MPGKIVHFELVAADADRATAFWSGLFPWQVGESAMEGFDYRMFQTGTTRAARSTRPRTRSARRSSTSTPTTSTRRSRTCASSAAQAEEKQPVPTHGWFAACKDTEGNSFSLWQGDPNAA